jgi:hypothetical protein
VHSDGNGRDMFLFVLGLVLHWDSIFFMRIKLQAQGIWRAISKHRLYEYHRESRMN